MTASLWLAVLVLGLPACGLRERLVSLTMPAEERFLDEYSDTTIFVSTEGNDAWSGLLCCPNKEGTDGPFATFERARDASPAVGADVPRRIIVREGAYYDVSWVLTARDSNLSLEAAAGEEVILLYARGLIHCFRIQNGFCLKITFLRRRWSGFIDGANKMAVTFGITPRWRRCSTGLCSSAGAISRPDRTSVAPLPPAVRDS